MAVMDLASVEPQHGLGGKATNCARLLRAGFDVPPGVVLTSPSDDVLQASSRFPPGTLFAVRSSAGDEDGEGHSFAGIFQTLLNVEETVLAEAVARVWESMRGEQAAAYRQKLGLANGGGGSVLVQRMIVAEISGVAFTRDPVSGSDSEMVVNACWGLGEPLVSGQVEPDEIRLGKDGRVLHCRVGSKRHRARIRNGRSEMVETQADQRDRLTMDRGLLQRLGALLLQLERVHGAAQDVEWCYDGERFWIVQSRPITGAVRVTPRKSGAFADETDLRGVTGEEALAGEWTRANLREVLPDLPSPQVLVEVIAVLNQSLHDFFGSLVGSGDVVRTFCGRPYFSVDQFRALARNLGIPPATVLQAMGHQGVIEAADRVATLPPLRALPALARVGLAQLALEYRLKHLFAEGRRALQAMRAQDPRALSDAELAQRVSSWREQAMQALRPAYAAGGLVSFQRVLEKICQSVGMDFAEFFNRQLAAGPKTVSAQQGFDLLMQAHWAREEKAARAFFAASEPLDSWRQRLAGTRFLQQFDGFLERYGHRGHFESDWAIPRFREDPTPLLFAIRSLVQAPSIEHPHDIMARQELAAARSWQEFVQRTAGRWYLPPLARWLLRKCKQMYLLRERNRFEMIRMVELVRRWHLVIAARFVERGWIDSVDDYFMIALPDVAAALRNAALGAGLRSQVAARRREREEWQRIDMPLLLRNFTHVRNAPANDGEVSRRLVGLCTSPGRVEGEVCVLRDPAEFARMRAGAILVAPATDPSWTPLFLLAAGVITEIGGTLSHASTIAREFGLPALANVRDATRRLRDGDKVCLDATAGWVEVLDS